MRNGERHAGPADHRHSPARSERPRVRPTQRKLRLRLYGTEHIRVARHRRRPPAGDEHRPFSCQSSGSGTMPPAVGPIQSASVSANPSVVSTNTATTTNQTQIRALFVGPDNAPIQNVRVVVRSERRRQFDRRHFLRPAPTVVYSDANGVATTSYIPGTRSSPTNGVTIRACYSTNDFAAGACPNSATTTITVVSDPLVGVDRQQWHDRVGPTNLTYIRQFVVLVVDASGQRKGQCQHRAVARSGLLLQGPVRQPGRLVPGYVGFPTSSPVQYLAAAPFQVPQRGRESKRRSGDRRRHQSQRQSLEPRKSDATITILGNGETDAHGSAMVQVEYPQNVASWLHVNILVSATGVSGTEGRAIWSEILPVPPSASAATSAPPFIFSPYGIDISGNPIPRAIRRLSLDSFGQHTLFPDGTVPPARSHRSLPQPVLSRLRPGRQPDRHARRRQVDRRQAAGQAPCAQFRRCRPAIERVVGRTIPVACSRTRARAGLQEA